LHEYFFDKIQVSLILDKYAAFLVYAEMIQQSLFDFNILSNCESAYVKDVAQMIFMLEIHHYIHIIEDVAYICLRRDALLQKKFIYFHRNESCLECT
jgi:hypothetical protein